MDVIYKYQSMIATRETIEFINTFIKNNPGFTRKKISVELCKIYNWRQSNGVLRDQVCRSFLLGLHREGHIELPPARMVHTNSNLHNKRPASFLIEKSKVECSLKELKPIRLEQVRRTNKENIFNGLLSEYHYLGFKHPVGESLKYLAYSNERPLACFSFSSAPRVLDSRDSYIGWDKDTRIKNIHFIAYNTRFLVLPWVNVRYFASHLLSLICRRISSDWQGLYNHPIYLLETFVDTNLFKGTCYKAANWISIGKTKGIGYRHSSSKNSVSIKEVLCYPLTKNFQELLNGHN